MEDVFASKVTGGCHFPHCGQAKFNRHWLPILKVENMVAVLKVVFIFSNIQELQLAAGPFRIAPHE